MDDSEVVKVLAEFMGIWPHDATGNVLYLGSELAVAVPLGEARIARHFPNYIQNYNAIAEVWSKVYQELGYDGEADAMKALFGNYPHSVETYRAWFLKSPRDHARALAGVIAESNKRRPK